MDIDDFLDREITDLGSPTEKPVKTVKPGATNEPEAEEKFEPSPLFENIKNNLDKGNLEQADLSYVQLWHILMRQKLKWDNDLYEQLSILSRQFSSVLNQAYEELKKKADHVYGLISRARAALREGKKELPFKIYSEIEEINNSIPNIFFEEKNIIQEQIMDFYKELRDTTDNELLKRVSALIQEITHLIDRINTSIGRNDMVNSVVNYNKCIKLYTQVPEGFLKHKNSAGIRLLDIYKTLSIYTEISTLQNQLNPPSRSEEKTSPSEHASSEHVTPPHPGTDTKSMLIDTKKERAKDNIQKGLYDQASRDIGEVLQIDPNDAEAKAIHAKIKTLV